jgi:hypothetical protein
MVVAVVLVAEAAHLEITVDNLFIKNQFAVIAYDVVMHIWR